MNDNDKIGQQVLLVGSIISVITVVAIILCFTSCQYLPQLANDATEVADDTAIKTEISKEAIQKDTDLSVYIIIKNKDEQPTK